MLTRLRQSQRHQQRFQFLLACQAQHVYALSNEVNCRLCVPTCLRRRSQVLTKPQTQLQPCCVFNRRRWRSKPTPALVVTTGATRIIETVASYFASFNFQASNFEVLAFNGCFNRHCNANGNAFFTALSLSLLPPCKLERCHRLL